MVQPPDLTWDNQLITHSSHSSAPTNMKIIPASDGAVRWVAIAFFICAQAAVCLPVGEFSVRIPPCQLLTLTTDTGKWSPSGKPMVFYTLEGRDFTTATNAAAADVCKGTVTLRVGAVLNALVYVRRDATQVRRKDIVCVRVREAQCLCVQVAGAYACLVLRRSYGNVC